MSKKIIIFLIILFVIILGIFIILNYKKTATNIYSDLLENEQQNNNANLKNLTWKELPKAPWNGRDSHSAVVFKGKIWVMGGVDGATRLISPGNVDYGNAPHFSDIWTTSDGMSWEKVVNKAPWGQRRSMQVVVFKNKMWLFGGWGPELGAKRDVWSSADGTKWKLELASAPWEAREGHQAIVFNNKIWMVGGVNYSKHKLFNDTWYTEDGINWKQASGTADWTPRWDFALTDFDNKLWAIGGMDFNGLYKDVWSSVDGTTWNLVNKNPPFEERQGFSDFNYKNKLVVVGRLNAAIYGGGQNDVWFSSDGITWEKTEKDPSWTGREDFPALIYKDKIWIIGGMDKNWIWQNDVWQSEL